MALTTAYLLTTKNLDDFLNSIVTAQAPEKFSQSFLEKLGLTSSNDRLFVGVLKGLGFLDDTGAPTQRYFNYLDQTQSGTVLAEALREAYGALFAINNNAQNLEIDEVKNKLRTLTSGQKSEKVLLAMANTFKALADKADWTKGTSVTEIHDRSPQTLQNPKAVETEADKVKTNDLPKAPANLGLHYNIQIHLPESRDPAVFDAIFRALKEHLC